MDYHKLSQITDSLSVQEVPLHNELSKILKDKNLQCEYSISEDAKTLTIYGCSSQQSEDICNELREKGWNPKVVDQSDTSTTISL